MLPWVGVDSTNQIAATASIGPGTVPGPSSAPSRLPANLPAISEVEPFRRTQRTTRTHLIRERINFVAVHYCRHRKTMTEIADLMAAPPPVGLGTKISRQMVARYLQMAEAQWREDSMRSMDEWKAREVADLDHMETQAARHSVNDERADQQQWFRSRLAVKERRAKMLGLDAEQRVKLEGAGAGGGMLTIALLDLIIEQAGLDYDARDEHGIPITMLAGNATSTITSTASTVTTTVDATSSPAGLDVAGPSSVPDIPSSSKSTESESGSESESESETK